VKIGTDISAKTLTISMMLNVRNLGVYLHRHVLNIPLPQYWRNKLSKDKLTSEEIEVRIWAIVVISITAILFCIVIALLYSVTFVVQPLKAMAPIDQAYTKMLNDIVLLLVGGIGGIVGKRVVGGVAGTLAGVKQATTPSPMMGQGCYPMQSMGFNGMQQMQPTGSQSFGALQTFQNPQFDESWTPPPPPSGPPVLEHDEERERMAQARSEV